MVIVALLIGLVLIAAAIRGTQGALFSALGTDLPAYAIWAAALVAVAAIGFIPGLKTPSRYLLALVVVVLILNNYQSILSGFAAVSEPPTAKPMGGTAPTGGSASPPASALAGAATLSTSSANASGQAAGANLFGLSPGASAFGEQLGQAASSTFTDAANSFATALVGGGP